MAIFQMQKEDSASNLLHSHWDVALIGISLDDRCDKAISFARENAETTIEFIYNPVNFTISLDGRNEIDIDKTDEFIPLFKEKSILLEATSLGFVEMLIACKAIKAAGITDLSYLYVEPKGYRKPKRDSLLQLRDYELSDIVPGYNAIPGHSFMLNDYQMQKVTFFVGYEASRLDRAFEEYPMIRPENSSIVFGVPAFNAGWEIDSFANNISIIIDRHISGGIHYCSASNPLSSYLKLNELYQSLFSEEQMFVAPIGTTPEAIGVIHFVIEYPLIGLLYDHPIKLNKRSSEVAAYHLYNVVF